MAVAFIALAGVAVFLPLLTVPQVILIAWLMNGVLP